MKKPPYFKERLTDHTCFREDNAGNCPGLQLFYTKIGRHPEYQLYDGEALALFTNLGVALGILKPVHEWVTKDHEWYIPEFKDECGNTPYDEGPFEISPEFTQGENGKRFSSNYLTYAHPGDLNTPFPTTSM